MLPDATCPNWHHEEALAMDVENLLMKAGDNLSVRRAFGTVYEKDDMLIIPVATVAGGGGGGAARPRRDDPAAGPGPLPEGGPAGHHATPHDSRRTPAGASVGSCCPQAPT